MTETSNARPQLYQANGFITLAILVGITILVPLAGIAEETPEIQDVRTVADLAGQQPISTGDGWEVRLGMGDAGEDAGPWRLIYCLSKRTDDARELDGEISTGGGDEFLGPVRYSVRQHNELREVLKEIEIVLRIPESGALYCDRILTAWKGRYSVFVYAYDGKLLTERDFEIETPTTCYWQQFARSEPLGADSEVDAVLRENPFAAVPSFNQLLPIWQPDKRLSLKTAAMLPLPGEIPMDYAWLEKLPGGHLSGRKKEFAKHALKLSLKEGVFSLESIVPITQWPDKQLLARWWVNGRPVAPKTSEEYELKELRQEEASVKRIEIALGVPQSVGELKVGDKVGLQILYSPAPVKLLRRSRREELLEHLAVEFEHKNPAVPMLSNKITFEVTSKLMESRPKR